MEGRKRKFLSELQSRPKLRAESSMYFIDGIKMCLEAPDEDVEEYYITQDFLKKHDCPELEVKLARCGCVTVTESEMKQICDTVSPQGIAALVRQRKTRGIADLFRGTGVPLVLFLENISDPGNMGTIIRASEAAGVSGIIISAGSVDVYSPKVVRSTMGSLFRVPFTVVPDIVRAAGDVAGGAYTSGMKLDLYAARLDAERDYCGFDYTKPSGFMIGNESKGLSQEMSSMATHSVIIPMHGCVESLNAAMAAVVLLFEAARVRRLLP